MANPQMAEPTALKMTASDAAQPSSGTDASATRFLSLAWLIESVTRLRSVSVDLRLLTFTVMMAVAVVPIMLFYNWIERSSFEKEISYVDENHLVVAKNLSLTLSRYITDTKSVFALVVANRHTAADGHGFEEALSNFDLCHIMVLNKNNQMQAHIEGKRFHSRDLPDRSNLAHLRQLAAKADGGIVISGIRNHTGQPHFFLAQQLPDGSLALAPWTPNYISELQKSISFGQRGHSMIVDQHGRVVAHPNAEWQQSSKDASKLSVIQAMMAGKSGVMQFYSPPMQAQMIAAYTSVPETGWGVMVPQPLSELEDRAQVVQQAAIMIAVFEISLVAFVSLWFSNLLIGPIQAVARAAHRMSSGDHSAHIWSLPQSTPGEIMDLAKSFNSMVDDIQAKTDDLKLALDNAEKVADERSELLAAAQHANEIKTQFVSMVSHELRTPLTSIKGSLELMNSGKLGSLTAQTKELVEIATKNSEHLSSLINDLLDLDKLGAGKIRYKFTSINMVTLLEDSLRANHGYGHLRKVDFRLHSDVPIGPVKGDYTRLMQVMANLLSNAAKFSDPESQVDVRMQTSDSHIRISVQDYGIGIPQDAKESVFEKFVQLDPNNARKVGGTGLGLSIAQLIVEGHGGKLAYDSKEGHGTTFHFDLPKA